ncbi:probable Tfp pilus assembly protein PilW [gamma proteobacterium HdN1]|nr:probable Tfp pilus assembly protein PilW [gamma proteobacterium HdN1]
MQTCSFNDGYLYKLYGGKTFNWMRGLTLVELMIGLLLSSMLVVAIFQLLLSVRGLSAQAQASASLVARASYVSTYLMSHLVEAGYAPVSEPRPYPVGVEGAFAGMDHPLYDQIVLLSHGGRGCTDLALNSGEALSWRRFSVGQSNGRSELRCTDSEGGPYPVLEGVDALQVQYGVDANRDGSPDYYTNFLNLPKGAPIVALRVGLLLRSDVPARYGLLNPQVGVGALDLLDQQLPTVGASRIDQADGYLRKAQVITVALRNLM